jgi:hypothetical protein
MYMHVCVVSQDQSTFLVGCGALGCEFLKNFALMGIASGEGTVHCTDNDRIEVPSCLDSALAAAPSIGRCTVSAHLHRMLRVLRHVSPGLAALGTAPCLCSTLPVSLRCCGPNMFPQYCIYYMRYRRGSCFDYLCELTSPLSSTRYTIFPLSLSLGTPYLMYPVFWNHLVLGARCSWVTSVHNRHPLSRFPFCRCRT